MLAQCRPCNSSSMSGKVLLEQKLAYHVEDDNIEDSFHVVLACPGARCSTQGESFNADGTASCHMPCNTQLRLLHVA